MNKVQQFKIGETRRPIRLFPITRASDGCEGVANMAGSSATFTLYDTDKVTRLLDAVPASVELDGTTLIAVRFSWTSAHWSTLTTAKGEELDGEGYKAGFEITDSSGDTFWLPNETRLHWLPLQLLKV